MDPAIHGGLLARDSQTDFIFYLFGSLGWAPIDLAAVNFYYFEQTIANPDSSLQDAIENIDIGGVALIREPLKITNGSLWSAIRKIIRKCWHICGRGLYHVISGVSLPEKGFQLTAHYDTAISAYLLEQPAPLDLRLYPVRTLRYGENPHQTAALYNYQPHSGPLGGQVLQGKALSYNNLLDLDAAWRAALAFPLTVPPYALSSTSRPVG